ncbi:MAG: DUF2894 domain-containing protein [Burkholderiaceae bacterium]
MSGTAVKEAQALLALWREQGADRADPVRYHFIDSLARRAESHDGEARRLLDARLSGLLRAHQGGRAVQPTNEEAHQASAAQTAIDHAQPALANQAAVDQIERILASKPKVNRAQQDPAAQAGEIQGGALAGLAAYIASSKPQGGVLLEMPDATGQGLANAEPATIDYFRNVWSRVGTKRMLRQSKARVPDNAGPLNSTNLVHRSLALMGERSPEYLHRFLSYLDALSWLEQLSEGGLISNKEGTPAPSAKRAPRSRQR